MVRQPRLHFHLRPQSVFLASHESKRLHTGDKTSTRPSARGSVRVLTKHPAAASLCGWGSPASMDGANHRARRADPASPERQVAPPPRGEAIDDFGSIGQPRCANGRGGGAQAAGRALQAAGGCEGEWPLGSPRASRGPLSRARPKVSLRSLDRLPDQPGPPGLLGAGWESRVQG